MELPTYQTSLAANILNQHSYASLQKKYHDYSLGGGITHRNTLHTSITASIAFLRTE